MVMLATAFLFAIGDAWLGWSLVLIVLFGSYPFALLIKLQQKETLGFTFIMYVHIAMAVLCFYFMPQIVLAFGVDANGFVREALQQEPFPFGVGVGAYVNFLRLFAAISPSVFSLYMTSLIGLTLACFVLLKILRLLEIRSYYFVILLFVTLVPTDIISTSIALREPWQVLFVLCSAYFSLSLSLPKSRSLRHVVGLILSLICLGLLHRGLVYVAIIWPFLFFVSLWFMRSFERLDFIIKLFLILFVLAFGCAVLAHLASQFSRFADSALAFSSHVHEGNSTYTIFFQAGNSFLTNIFHLPLALLYYWFYPFPWAIHRVKDIYGCIVGLMRLFFILYSFYFVLTSPEPRQRHLGGALLIVMLMISMVFAIGTSNYGTSLRHNILTFWGFVTLGVPGFYLHCYRRRCRRLGVAP